MHLTEKVASPLEFKKISPSSLQKEQYPTFKKSDCPNTKTSFTEIIHLFQIVTRGRLLFRFSFPTLSKVRETLDRSIPLVGCLSSFLSVVLVRCQDPKTSSLSRTTGTDILFFSRRVESIVTPTHRATNGSCDSFRQPRIVHTRGVSTVTARPLLPSTFLDIFEIVYRWVLFSNFYGNPFRSN